MVMMGKTHLLMAEVPEAQFRLEKVENEPSL